jgi:hypothetical protein
MLHTGFIRTYQGVFGAWEDIKEVEDPVRMGGYWVVSRLYMPIVGVLH